MEGVLAIAVAGLLVRVILTGNVIPEHCVVWIPSEVMAEFSVVLRPENIFIGYHAPNTKGFLSAFFDYRNFGIGDKLFHGSTDYVRLVGPHYSCIFNLVFVCQRELEIFWDRDRQNIRSRPYLNLSGLGVPSIEQVGSPLKLKIALAWLSPFLIQSRADLAGEVSAQHSLVARFNGSHDFFHCSGRAGRFSNMALHCLRLLPSGFDGFPQLIGLITKYDQLQESNSRKYASQIDQIPIIRRFVFTVFTLLLGFFGSLSGWKHFNDNRRSLGAALLCGSWLLGCLGFLILLL